MPEADLTACFGKTMENLRIVDLLRLSSKLTGVSDSPRLDVEILLAHAINKDRTFLFTWPEKILTPVQVNNFELMFQQRLLGRPIAHIIGQREFWSLSLFVDNTTLIPRPESEMLVEKVLALFVDDMPGCERRLLDLGTGTGAIALAIASEKKSWRCVAVDKELAAVNLAEKNRAHLNIANLTICQSDWFSAIGNEKFHVIVSNPPYIDPDDVHLQNGDVRFEPLSALIAGNQGLADIEFIVQHAQDYLLSDAWLLVEHGYNQGEAVRNLFAKKQYRDIETLTDLNNNERITVGRNKSW